MIFSFFLTGSASGDMLCKSIRHTFNSRQIIIQLSDKYTAKSKFADHVIRFDYINPQALMYSRMRAYKDCLKLVQKPIAFFDADILIVKKFILDFSSAPFLCKRSYGCNNLLSERIKINNNILSFPEHRGKTMKQIYPYVGCFFADKNHYFLEQALIYYKRINKKYLLWYGDQIALREVSKSFEPYPIDESLIACDPLSYQQNKLNVCGIHFKGEKYKIMGDFYKKVFATSFST